MNIRLLKLIIVCLLFVIVSCADVPENSGMNHIAIPKDLKPHINLAQSIGHKLFILDHVAALATDVMFENVPEFKGKNMGGYIPLREGDENGNPIDSYLVAFYTNENPPKIAYEVRVAQGKMPEFEAFDPPKPAMPDFVYLANARRAAIASIPEITQPINPVLFPGEIFGKDGVIVYLLAGTSDPDVAVFGKHYRAHVRGDDASDVELVALTKTALQIPLRTPNGKKPVALVVTQIVTDWPTEIHVFASLLYKIGVYVGTKRGKWYVDGTHISLLEEKP